MTRIDAYPPGVPCFVDCLTDDLDAARRFYSGLFGWAFTGPGQMPTEPPGEYWTAHAEGALVAGLGTRVEPAMAPGWSTHIAVTAVDGTTARVSDAGGVVLTEPFDVPPAGRLAVVADPGGAVLCLWEAGRRTGAELVNAPSAWAMSLLRSSDPERAGAFYAELFGWRAEPLAGAPAGVQLLRLPGYVGGEPEQPVPRDVVAAMAPADGRPDAWGVDFWIADTDAAVAATPQLGGTVLAGPFEIPMFRQAVIAAPDGAVFSISQLQRD